MTRISGQRKNWVLGTISGFLCILESALSAAISSVSYAVMMAVTVVRYATCSYASSVPVRGTTVVASDFASN